jgi:hypothetical protein
MSRISPNTGLAKRTCPENGIEEAPGFSFQILLEVRKPPDSKTWLVHCIRTKSGVRYP